MITEVYYHKALFFFKKVKLLYQKNITRYLH